MMSTFTTLRNVACAISITGICSPIAAQPTPARSLESTGFVQDRLDEISGERAKGTIAELVRFGTRHTLSDAESDMRGIGAARRWIKQTLESFGGRLEVRLDPHSIPAGRRLPDGAEVVNVVAVLPGTMPEASDRLYYVMGHYDSRVSDPMDARSDAPGANDDGSGTAVVVELARILADERLDATVVFMAVAGEEQGLYGARAHADALGERGADVAGVLNNDIVGDPTGPQGQSARDRIRVFSEGIPISLLADPGEGQDGDRARARERQIRGLSLTRLYGAENDSPSRQLARYVVEVALRERTAIRPELIYRADRYLRGGDHTPFNENGYPAIRFCEVHENYARQHQDLRTEDRTEYGDLLEHVDAGYLADVAELNLATIIHLANAPAVPGSARIIVAELTNDTTLRWDPSPEPDVAGYEVVWRKTTSPVWEHVRDVGDVTEATIELSKDNWLFGVRAYDDDGYRSPVAFPTAARR